MQVNSCILASLIKKKKKIYLVFFLLFVKQSILKFVDNSNN